MSPWPPELFKPEPITDAEWDRLAAKYATPVPSPLERWARAQSSPFTVDEAYEAHRRRFASRLEAQDAIDDLERAGVLERYGLSYSACSHDHQPSSNGLSGGS